MTITDEHISELLSMLTLRRPAGSLGEELFIQDYVASIPGCQPDDYGNYHVTIGDNPTTLFSSHTDTVHRDTEIQNVKYDTVRQEIYKTDGAPLGADNATGVWIMRRMLEAGIPGLYIFHREEEIGGRGSNYIATTTPERLYGIKRAIAFDRRGTSNVITFQGGTRCCSELFAKALSAELDMAYAPNPTGVFTDTANYTYDIPECTNLSVGYNGEHTQAETQDVAHLLNLVPALCRVNWEALPTVRDTSIIEDAPEYTSIYNIHTRRSSGFDEWGEWDEPRRERTPLDSDAYDLLAEIVYEEPEAVTDFLLDMGISPYDILPYIPTKHRATN